MKKLMLTIATALLLVGCGQKDLSPAEESNAMRVDDFRQRFIFVDGDAMMLMIDKETGVQYLAVGTGGLTVVVDADGKPLIANGWRDND